MLSGRLSRGPARGIDAVMRGGELRGAGLAVTRKLAGMLGVGAADNQPHKFGTFGGVFTPDVLTILGVIMYLRLGWVVGNAGFLGAVLIIVLAKAVTVCTGLSMASITTNTRIGAGGAYSLISKSLGLEAGGSIGIPFYISQTLSVALYIIGFTEGWLLIFPDHPTWLIAVLIWMILLAISSISARFAIKIQYVIMAVIVVSLVSVVFSESKPLAEMPILGGFEDAGFWAVFAIFFPAVTGIMAGANMSGDLEDPRKAIPLGTLSAIAVTFVIYVGLAFLCARLIPAESLRTNQMVLVDMALWGPAVTAGILAATFSSALGSMVGAPRILQALAEQKTVPFYLHMAKKTAGNEPRNAIVFTGLVVLVAILMGNLNALASLITLFFLITYGTLNLVVFIQQSMKMISFRPTFKIPKIVSLFGAVSCLFIMFLIDPIFSMVAMAIIIAIYVWLTKKGLKADWGDIRGGMFVAIAERASRWAAKFPRHQVSWKPDLLLPVDDPKIWAGPLLFIRSITYPSGSVFAFSVQEKETEQVQNDLNDLLKPLRREGILVRSTLIEDRDFLHGAKLVIQTLKGGTLRPNTLFVTFGKDSDKDNGIKSLTSYAKQYEMGMVLLHQHPRMAFGMQKTINLWLRDKSPNWHLAMLIALQLQLNWEGNLNLITVTPSKKEKKRLFEYLESLSDQARLPFLTEFKVLIGDFQQVLETAPPADVNIFGMGGALDLNFLRHISDLTNSSCLFVSDSGHEDALA